MIDTHTIQFCCGTTCDSKLNLAYVRELEAKNRALIERNADLETMFTLAMRMNPLEINHGPTKGDTEGVTSTTPHILIKA